MHILGDIATAARNLLLKDLAPGTEATPERVRAKFGTEDPIAVAEVARAAVAESRSHLLADAGNGACARTLSLCWQASRYRKIQSGGVYAWA